MIKKTEYWQENVFKPAMQYFLADVMKELEIARDKFPDQDIWVTLAALTEEIGELNQAILQFNFQPEKFIDINDIRKEAIQSIVMILRVLLDTDLGKGKRK